MIRIQVNINVPLIVSALLYYNFWGRNVD
ncbi:hypothetical protein Godav_009775, partial [Gossypium davidsonii]|nr:hypothetical protein [Gossypium davidsonii]